MEMGASQIFAEFFTVDSPTLAAMPGTAGAPLCTPAVRPGCHHAPAAGWRSGQDSRNTAVARAAVVARGGAAPAAHLQLKIT